MSFRDSIPATGLSYYMNGATQLTSINIDKLNKNKIINMVYTYRNC
jgi:hypothetical protein